MFIMDVICHTDNTTNGRKSPSININMVKSTIEDISEDMSCVVLLKKAKQYEINNDIPNMIKYYELASIKGNTIAICKLGYYYYNNKKYTTMMEYYKKAIELKYYYAYVLIGDYYYINNNINTMIKYYKLAIDNNIVIAMTKLAQYYISIKKVKLMEKYMTMAIDHGDVISMNEMASFYRYYKKDYVLMKKYYDMAIEKGDTNAMINLADYYAKIKNDHINMEKYYIMAIKHNNYNAYVYLGDYYNNKNNQVMIKCYELSINYGIYTTIPKLINYYYTQSNYDKVFYYIEMMITNKIYSQFNKEAMIKYHDSISDNQEKLFAFYQLINTINKNHQINGDTEEIDEDIEMDYIFENEDNSEEENSSDEEEDDEIIKDGLVNININSNINSNINNHIINDDCPICLEEKTLYATRCGRHYVCIGCQIHLVCKSCPICRQ